MVTLVMSVRSARELGAVIRARRQELQFSQAQLAEIVGVSRPWLSEVENGKPGAELSRVLRVIDGLGLDVLIDEREQRGPASGSPSIDLDDLLEDYRRR